MWMRTMASMKFEPQPCSARMNQPAATCSLMTCKLPHASPAEGT